MLFTRTLLSLAGAILAAHLLALPLEAQQPDGAAPPPTVPYQVGERLTYNVSFSQFVTAAHVELLVAAAGTYGGRAGVELHAHVETTDIVGAALYALNNDYVSIVDPMTGIPFRSQQMVRSEGMPRSGPAGTGITASAAAASLPFGQPGTLDLLSALYRLRALPLVEGGVQRLSASHEGNVYEAELKVTGRQSVKTSVGSFNTLVVEVRVPRQSRANDYRVRVFLSDDAKRLPVVMTARHPAGEIRAELASVSILTEPAPTPTPASPPVVVARRNDPAGDSGALPSDLPFASGEQLNYQLFLGSGQQAVANITYQVRPRAKYFGRDGLLFSASAQTNELGQRVILVNDQMNSYVDPVTLLPFRTETNLQEGRRRLSTTLSLDQDRGVATNDKGQRFDIPLGTHDLISVFYALRSINLSPQKRNAVTLIINNRPRALFIDALQREVLTLGAQRIPAIQLALSTDEQQGNKYAVRMWVGTDRRRLPLRITAISPLGPIRLDLAVIPAIAQ